VEGREGVRRSAGVIISRDSTSAAEALVMQVLLDGFTRIPELSMAQQRPCRREIALERELSVFGSIVRDVRPKLSSCESLRYKLGAKDM